MPQMVAILPRISGDIARRSANAVTAVGNHHAINGRIFDGLPDKVLSISTEITYAHGRLITVEANNVGDFLRYEIGQR